MEHFKMSSPSREPTARKRQALTLLRHAARLFAAEGLGGGEACCQGLLGLLRELTH
jgi:hypothetical protein